MPVRFLNLLTSQASLEVGHAFLKKFIPSNDHLSMLFFMGGQTIAITQKKKQFCYVFDLHSRDERVIFVPNGNSVLLKCKGIFELEKYIQVAYLEYRDRTQQFFQVQLVEIDVDENLRLD